MTRTRWPFAVLLAAGTAAAFGMAAGSGPDQVYRLSYSLVVLGMLVAVLAARYRGPFWHGFAVVGWAYFLLGMGPWFALPNQPTPLAFPTANDDLLPARWVRAACDRLVETWEVSSHRFDPLAVRQRWRANTYGIAHCGMTLLLAVSGGLATVVLAEGVRPASADEAGMRPWGRVRRVRVVSAAMLATLALAGLAAPAFIFGSEAWRRATTTATALIFLAATLLAVYRRPFWFGFAWIGWGVFLLGQGPWFFHNTTSGPPYSWMNDSLLTSFWLERAAEPLTAFSIELAHGFDLPRDSPKPQHLMAIVHAMLSLLMAVAGGLGAEVLAAGSTREQSPR